MDYTTEIWGKERQDEDAGVKDWLKSFYSGKQSVEDIEVTPELRERYNRFIEAASKQYVPEASPNYSNAGTLGQSVLQNVTKAGLSLADLLQRSGRFLNPYLAGPAQDAARQNLSQELGYGIAGAEELEREKGLPPGLAQKIVAAVSQMAVDIPAKYANPLWAGVMVAEGALGGLDKGRTADDIARQIGEDRGGFVPQDTRTAGETALDVLKGGGEGAISAATLKGLGTVGKLAPGYARPLIEGGGFAGMAAAPALSGEPVDINDIVSNALIGGFFGFKKRNEPRKTLGDFKKYVSEKLGRNLTLDENIDVSRAGLDAIEATRPFKDKAAELAELQKQAEIEFGVPKPTKLEDTPGPTVVSPTGESNVSRPPVSTGESVKNEASGGISEPVSGPKEYVAVGDKKQHKIKIVSEEPQIGVKDPMLGDGPVIETRKIDGVSVRELSGNGYTTIKGISNITSPRIKGEATDFMVGEIRTEHAKGNAVLSDSFITSKQAYEMHDRVRRDHPEFDFRVVDKNEGGDVRVGIFRVGDARAMKYEAWKGFGEKPPTPPTMNKLPTPEAPKAVDMAAPKPEATITEAPPPGEPPTPGGMKPYEPVMKESGPAKDVWKKAVEDGLADPENPWAVTKYESANKKEFAERTIDYIGNDINRGWDVIEGKTQPPPGTSTSSFFLAMRDYVNNSGDGALVNRLTKASGLSRISEAASTIGQLSGYKKEETPVDAKMSIEKNRKKHVEEIKENPLLKNVLENRMMKAQDKLAEAMARHQKEIEQLKAIWVTKRLNQYKKKLGKKELTLTEKIKAGDFTKDPQYKIWLDQQTRSSKKNVEQLQRTFNKLKENADRRETGVSDEETQKLVDLYDDMRQKKIDVANGRDRMAYGRAYVDYHEYVDALKFRATKLTVGEALRMPVKTASKIAGISKAIKASFDNSYIFRQGFKMMWSHPRIWLNNSLKSFKWAVQQYGGKHVMRELMADIVSRPNYMNGKMERAKLAFGNPEEPFPTSLPEKFPGIGRIYKASETAFAGQAYKNRADLFDKFMEVEVGGKKMVEVADKKQLESIGKLINSLTGRGYIGKTTKEQAEFMNNVFFSLRFLKSNYDFLTAHQTQKGVTPFVRKEAAKNLIKAAAGTAFVLAVADALKPGSVDWDARSADFGKIKIGNTRFDVTGGMGSLIILASRMIQGSTKSSVSGKISKGTGIFGDPMDYVYNFFEGKLAPVSSTLVSLAKRKDYRTRKPPTPWDIARRTTLPLPFENAEELLRDPKSADFLLSLILDGLGIGTNTYGAPNKKGNPSRPVGGFDYTI
jgi:hypothetical protein